MFGFYHYFNLLFTFNMKSEPFLPLNGSRRNLAYYCYRCVNFSVKICSKINDAFGDKVMEKYIFLFKKK